jgi:hypothetical protein
MYLMAWHDAAAMKMVQHQKFDTVQTSLMIAGHKKNLSRSHISPSLSFVKWTISIAL